jgi:hypothetical protein
MTMPRFTAAASLYKSRGQYPTSRHIVNPSAQTVARFAQLCSRGRG